MAPSRNSGGEVRLCLCDSCAIGRVWNLEGRGLWEVCGSPLLDAEFNCYAVSLSPAVEQVVDLRRRRAFVITTRASQDLSLP